MSLNSIPAKAGQGAGNYGDVVKAVQELQRLKKSVVAGAAAGTKMNVAALRTEDTIISAIVSTDAGGALADDTANITIQGTQATGTVTVAAVADGDSVVVDGVTYTFKDAPTLINHVKRTAGNDNANAAKLRDVINQYPFRSGGAQRQTVKATASAAVVTLTAVVDGVAGNSITLTSSTGVRLAVTGAGTLTNGTATGGIKSSTNLTNKSVILTWFDKNP
jgi:hypothetical protein